MFKVVAKEKRLLMWAYFMICMTQPAQMALSAGINVIQQTVFPDKSLALVQTAMSLPNLLSVVTGILSAILISAGITTKKAATIAGLCFVAVTGLLSIFLHTQFWQLISFSVLIGLGMGLFIPTSQSIMLDNFNEKERQLLSGLQFSFINIGGIILCMLAGYLITIVWYGGYLMLLILIPVIILAVIALPKEKHSAVRHESGQKATKVAIPVQVYYYAGVLLLFSLTYFVIPSNLSNLLSQQHLGNSATAGIATAVLMSGGAISGALFDKLSSKLDDLMIPLAFFVLFLGFTMLNLFASSLAMVFVSVFISGFALSLCLPQGIFSASKYVGPENSALATMFLSSISPGFGGFLSPVIFTNITQKLGGDSVQFRFQFVGIVALAFALIFLFNTLRRSKKAQTAAE